MSESDRLARLVAKLNQLTQEGEIDWTSPDHSLENFEGTRADARVISVFETVYKGKGFRLWKEAWTDEDGEQDRIRLAIKGFSGEIIFQFPTMAAVYDLYESAGFKVAGVAELMDELLED